MRFLDALMMSLAAILSNKMRSILTLAAGIDPDIGYTSSNQADRRQVANWLLL